MSGPDEFFDVGVRRQIEDKRVAARRSAQAVAKRILATLEYESTLRDLQARLREAEWAAARASRRRKEAANALVAAVRQQIERFERVEGPAMLRAAAAIADAISSALGTAPDPERPPAPEPRESPVGATTERAKPNGRSTRSPYG